MARSCSIYCPHCERPVPVWAGGSVACGACGRSFEVGVYSPPPERFIRDDLPLPEGLSISGNWIQVGNRTYPISDIVGTNLTRASQGSRAAVFLLTLGLALVALLDRQWLLSTGLGTLAVGLVAWWRLHPTGYRVSWITRGGREECISFPDRDSAQCWLSVIRPEGQMTLREHSRHVFLGLWVRLRQRFRSSSVIQG